jgi:menaquinone-dependent protoporphyrinogen oxidase
MSLLLAAVECRSVEEVEGVSAYSAVVVGSAIHNQAWLPTAQLFMSRHTPELAAVPVWAFSVGMADALPKPLRRRAAALQQDRLAASLKDVPLKGHRLFSGVYPAARMPAVLRMVFRLAGGRFGDLRDWAAIDSWTAEIADQLHSASPAGH